MVEGSCEGLPLRLAITLVKGGIYMPDYSWIDRSEKRYRYMLLDRLRMDCDYYIRNKFDTPRTL